MHSTRVATFLLGAWMAGCAMLDVLAIYNLRLSGRILDSAIPTASEVMRNGGRGQIEVLLRHFSSEQYRYDFRAWGWIQVAVLLLLTGVLYFAAERRVLPQVLCLAMLALVIFELAILPEVAYREWHAGALTAIWIGAEAVKLGTGGMLAAFLFWFRSTRRARRSHNRAALVRAN